MKRRRLRLKKRCQTTGKVRYRNRLDAVTALASTSRSLATQRVYPCPHCGCWHLTSMPKVNP